MATAIRGNIYIFNITGWDVRELCFYQGWENKDSIRKKDLECAANLLGMKHVEYYDIE